MKKKTKVTLWQFLVKPKMTKSSSCRKGPHVVPTVCDIFKVLIMDYRDMLDVSLGSEVDPARSAFQAYCCLTTSQPTYRSSTNFESLTLFDVSLDYNNFGTSSEPVLAHNRLLCGLEKEPWASCEDDIGRARKNALLWTSLIRELKQLIRFISWYHWGWQEIVHIAGDIF